MDHHAGKGDAAVLAAPPNDRTKEEPDVARKTTVPGNQLDRLKQLYTQQRDALTTLAAADQAVTGAKTTLAGAEQAVKDAQANADVAYQTLVDLTGANVAAELTGRGTPNRRGASTRKTQAEPGGLDGAEREPSTATQPRTADLMT
ncbi:MAG: hypothetical protein ACLP50_11170 [Solirubrobacteraceae bacterium]